MREPAQSRSRASSARMVQAALDAIEAGGWKSLNVSNVAQISGTSSGAIYHRFGNRDGLAAAAIEAFLSIWESEVGSLLDAADRTTDDGAAMLAFVSQWLDLFVRHRRPFRAFMIEAHDQVFLYERGTRASNVVAERWSRWTAERWDCDRSTAQAAYRLIFGLGVTRALWRDDQVVSRPDPDEEFRAAVAKAILGLMPKAMVGQESA